MGTVNSDIVAFLNARLDEDEAAAQAAIDTGALGDWEAVPVAELGGRRALSQGSSVFAVMDPVPEGRACAEHAARHDPARVLREVAAKRTVVALHTWTSNPSYCWSCSGDHGADLTPAPCGTLRHTTAVYADHPDYDRRWAP
jgi:hypothetical protein